jgi:hypothetical protein
MNFWMIAELGGVDELAVGHDLAVEVKVQRVAAMCLACLCSPRTHCARKCSPRPP